MIELDSPYLALLKDRITLTQIPFSDRGSRLLIFRHDHSLAVRLAERWFKAVRQLSAYRSRPPLIGEWCFTDEQGTPLELDITTYPHKIECRTRCGTFTIVFADTETLFVALPSGTCGVTFQANLDQAWPDRRGGLLRTTGDIRRNVAYTTNAHVVQNELEPIATAAHRIRLIVQ